MSELCNSRNPSVLDSWIEYPCMLSLHCCLIYVAESHILCCRPSSLLWGGYMNRTRLCLNTKHRYRKVNLMPRADLGISFPISKLEAGESRYQASSLRWRSFSRFPFHSVPWHVSLTVIMCNSDFPFYYASWLRMLMTPLLVVLVLTFLVGREPMFIGFLSNSHQVATLSKTGLYRLFIKYRDLLWNLLSSDEYVLP